MKHLLKNYQKLREIASNNPILLFLDLDGTLAPIAKQPHLAKVPQSIKKALYKLSKNRNIKIMIISGRNLADIKKMLFIPGMLYCGSHGLEFKGNKNLFKRYRFNATKFNRLLDYARSKIMLSLSGIKGIHFERKKFSLAVHYRLAPRNIAALIYNKIHSAVIDLQNSEAAVLQPGKFVLELLPPFDWNKGDFVKSVLAKQRYRKYTPIFVGDDLTDEHGFKVVSQKGLAVRVGKSRVSSAGYYLNGTKEVRIFLEKLTDLLNE